MPNRIDFEKNSSGDILMATLRRPSGAHRSMRLTLGGKREELYVAGKGPTNNDYYYAPNAWPQYQPTWMPSAPTPPEDPGQRAG